MYSAVVPAKPGTMFQGLREVRTLSQVYITSTPTGSFASGVRVRAAQYGLQPNSYVFLQLMAPRPSMFIGLPRLYRRRVLRLGAVSTRRLGFIYSLPVPLLEAIADKRKALHSTTTSWSSRQTPDFNHFTSCSEVDMNIRFDA